MRHSGTQMITTTRLLLRPFEQNDCGDMLAGWIGNPEVQAEYGEPVYTTPEQVKQLLTHWIARYTRPDFYRWAIIERQSGKNIGQIAFCKVYEDCRTAEIEYCIGENFWGNGYAGEALEAVIDFTFAHTGFLRLEAFHRSENIKSGRVLEKSRMERSETVERFRRAGQSPSGEVCYAITRANYETVRSYLP
ncbi:MAG: N-acetyltransferase [Clostridiales bacterium]|nr:MAG: N-acetyltransferase [Clostridiales bacterium]